MTVATAPKGVDQRWPALHLDDWLATYETLRRWTQIVGKTRLRLAPFVNHWWNVTLYVSARGLTTSVMPYDGGAVEIEFDFLADRLRARTSGGDTRLLRLEDGKSVAEFYDEYRAMLAALDVHVRIVAKPNEIEDATAFAEDEKHAAYDGDAVRRWWSALVEADRLLKRFRSGFVGKCSPSHFWWGGFDLACTRFSGRTAPPYQGTIPNCPPYVMLEAYSHECISAGWWPGTAGAPVTEPAFYAYAYPEPAGCNVAPITPRAAYYHQEMHEWILPYDAVRRAPDPDAAVLEFLESTYAVAAKLGNWDVAALRSPRGAQSAARSA
ncbi:MAG TPA: DUF5996 family protein [Gemmatimonadaceae bacterium]|nr:DUF5996 family protein [Gemmatimonadaceae bacterium]